MKLSHVDTTAVKLRPLSDAEIDRYIEREKPFDCGGVRTGLGIVLFERIDTEDPTAIVGLPLIWLAGRCAPWASPSLILRVAALRRRPRRLLGPQLVSSLTFVLRVDEAAGHRQRRAGIEFHARVRPGGSTGARAGTCA